MKKARYACTFHPDSCQFSWTKLLRKGPLCAYCMMCSHHISVPYGGNKDLGRHEQTAVNQSNFSTSVAGTSSITTFFHMCSPKRIESVVETEVKFGFFLAEHHLALALADNCSKLFPSLFLAISSVHNS